MADKEPRAFGEGEGLEVVEVRPGVTMKLNKADRKLYAQPEAEPEPESREDKVEEFGTMGSPIENATVEAPESAALPRSKPRTARRR